MALEQEQEQELGLEQGLEWGLEEWCVLRLGGHRVGVPPSGF